MAAAAAFWLALGVAQAQTVTGPAIDPADPTAETTDPSGAEATPPPPQPRLTIAPEEEPPPVRKRKRVEDPYAPPGLRLGGLVLHPGLGVGAVYTSNVQQSPSHPESDVGLSLKPSVAFASDWSRHAWNGRATANFLRWMHHSGLKADTADAASDFRLDIRHDTFASFDAGYTLTQTGLGNSQIPANAVGTRADQVISAGAGVTHDFGPWSGTLRGGIDYNSYGSVKLAGGGSQSNADRDNLAPSLTLRATYTDPPVFKPYVEASYQPKFYDQTRDSAGLKRSSQGVALSAGVVVADDPIWRGDLALTYLHRAYDDPTLGTAGAFGLTGSLTWSPTELTSVVLGLGTSLSDNVGSTTAADRVWSAKLAVNQAVRENIAVNAGIGATFEKVSGGSFDKTYTGNLGLEWKLNPSLAWTAGYDVTWLNAAQTSRNYAEHRLSVGLAYTR